MINRLGLISGHRSTIIENNSKEQDDEEDSCVETIACLVSELL